MSVNETALKWFSQKPSGPSDGFTLLSLPLLQGGPQACLVGIFTLPADAPLQAGPQLSLVLTLGLRDHTVDIERRMASSVTVQWFLSQGIQRAYKRAHAQKCAAMNVYTRARFRVWLGDGVCGHLCRVLNF
ncbi:hypothetical protein SKAU_G00240880 [Synaphobranchus kaupii]|uniref:Uncharacterized protein n=1 Tax=Synaphobranchus kaupii TaxID=118154 RepID=A0A9Q1F7F1_SYNKA|nr:hypothetical protein SKAU_G00240880 [Synaphobranchus kaupii]